MELLERDQHLETLDRNVAETRAGNGRVLLVAGEAGIGKTSLLMAFAKKQPKLRVLWGGCDALFTPRPLAPLHDIARQLQGPLQDALTANRSREQVFDAMLDELEREPSLVVFEDLHWADDATLDLIKFLGRRIQRTRALLVLTYRDDEVGPRHPLQFVIGDLPRASTSRILLTALSERAVTQLSKLAGRSMQELHRITGGNPLFVTEVLAASIESVPVTVRDAVLARVARLATPAREVAEFVSVVPGKAEAWLIEAATHADEAAIDGCLSIGMVRHADGALAFRHELTRRALEDSLARPRRERLHLQVLEALKQRSEVPAARLAHHADGARVASDALMYAREAAAQAVAVAAHREAAAHYRAALRYASDIPARERALLHEQLAYECYLTDQVEESIEVRNAALAIWQRENATLKVGDTLRWLSRLHWFAGRRAEASRFAGEAVATLTQLPPGRELSMAYSNRSQLAMLGHDAEGAIAWAQRAIALAEPAGDHDTLAHALNNLGTGKLVGGDASGWSDLERSLQIAHANNHHEHIARAYTNLSSTAVSARNYALSQRHLDDGIAYCERHDLDSWRLYMLAWRARMKLERGDWQGASDDVEIVLQGRHPSAVSRTPALIILGHLRVRRGDPDANGPLEQARELAGAINELQRTAPLAIAMAEAAWLAGNHHEAAQLIRPVLERALQGGDRWLKGELAAWLARAGALELIPDDVAEPFALELAGEFEAAAREWHALGCSYDEAMLLSQCAPAQQREALAIFERLGAAPAAHALRQRLRAQGVRGVPRGARASTKTHPHGLTKRESQIYELVTQGLRNAAIAKRLFLSTKTVDHHVSSILAKLGVPSRNEAIAMKRAQSDES